ncbi:MAG: ATP synthase F1 subunit delta [Lachnospiraceae bacterium]|nr:ATP synthase F1 subunit delta [Lachnospiraceae bacterium]
MKQTAINYGRVLFELGISGEDIADAKQIYLQSEELQKVLCSPIVSAGQKHQVIAKLFPSSMHAFLSKVCDYGEAAILPDIFLAYEACERQSRGILAGTLYYMTEPTKEQLGLLQDKLCKRFGCRQVQLTLEQDSSLIGGFVIRIGDLEIDQSILGSMNCLKQKLTRR